MSMPAPLSLLMDSVMQFPKLTNYGEIFRVELRELIIPSCYLSSFYSVSNELRHSSEMDFWKSSADEASTTKPS